GDDTAGSGIAMPSTDLGSGAAGMTFQLDLAATQAFVGEGGSGIRRIGQVLGRINVPMSGRLTIGGRDLSFLHEGVTGRRIGYVGPDPKLRSGSLFANLVYPLKHRPTGGESLEGRELREAELSGNSVWDVNAEWIDYAAAHATDRDALVKQAMSVLTTVDLDRDVYQLGLQGRVDPNTHPDLVDRIMTARAELRGRLDDPDLVNLVENFDARRYNTNMSVAENLLFGTPADDGFDFEAMADHPLIRDILDETNLTEELTAIGRQLAALMVDLFADVPPGSDLFEQFSFISSDDLPEFRSLLGRTDPNSLDALEARDQSMLLSLPLKLVPARHRLGLIDETLQSRLLRARSLVADRSGASGLSVEFFAAETYNVSGSVQDNILFGRLVYGRARAASQVGALIREVVEKLGLVEPIMEIGLDYEIGVSGARLSGAQRQKLSIARTLLKRPDLLVLDHATASLDSTSEAKIMSNLLEKRSDVGLIWVLQDANLAQNFDNTLVLEGGRVVQQGRAEELNTPDTAFSELLQPK
ncbi:MAG: ATP-binding cassette domain-containing protein, partial [Pseudomonadota bacterium]